jgi:transcriptional regulator with XRE-family HTH domain
MIFAASLRRERQARGLSQEELAHRAGLHRTFIGSVERGKVNVSVDNIERLSKAVGLHISFQGSGNLVIFTRSASFKARPAFAKGNRIACLTRK